MSEKITLKLPVSKRGRKSKADQEIYETQLQEFATAIMQLGDKISQKVSARGWCYLLEGYKLITKDQFDYGFKLINYCRKNGYIPIDFVLTDDSRTFLNVDELTKTPHKALVWVLSWLEYYKGLENRKNDIAFWESQEYYIQMMVEKIDVLNLFKGICRKYHIPISNAKGWSDMLSRYYMALRFKEAEELGLIPVLLYYGDFDPAGIKIADNMKENLRQIEKATKWSPDNLVIDHFGLTYEFIEDNNLMWIDNLMTGGKKNLADPKHPDHNKPYVRDYIKKYGVRKCEANAILPIKNIAKQHCQETIQGYLGKDPFETYKEKVADGKAEVKELLDSIDFQNRIEEMINELKNDD